MQYAITEDGRKVEAQKGLVASCPSCNTTMIAKCGEIVVHHWAHSASADCDPWSEPETVWHREWKTRIIRSPDYHEVVIGGPSGHRADVMTPNGIVVELQHSSISTEDITEREYFYTRKASGLIWLMDGTNLPHDRFVDEGDGWFKWKHPRKTWLTITAPQFWDMGSEIWEVIATCETGVKIRKMDVDDFVSLALGATEDGEYGSRGYFTRVTQLRDENHRLAAENHRLKAKASMAGDEKLGLIAKNHRLKDEVSRLKAAVLRGRSEVSRLTGDLTQLRDENHRLQAVVTRSGGREGFEERLEREKRYHQQDMKEFEARLDAAHQRSKRHHEEAEDWQRRHHQARAEARVLKAEVSRLQKCLRKAEVRLKREKSRLDDARPRTEIIEFALRDNDLVVGDDLLEDLDHIR